MFWCVLQSFSHLFFKTKWYTENKSIQTHKYVCRPWKPHESLYLRNGFPDIYLSAPKEICSNRGAKSLFCCKPLHDLFSHSKSHTLISFTRTYKIWHLSKSLTSHCSFFIHSVPVILVLILQVHVHTPG